ncbi:MAG: indole-3-glycerol phosphate synthase [Draconibacterium sp.]|nr:MAG: indole-3-glycerol phosphate synthase [Draconibacterium sp.]
MTILDKIIAVKKTEVARQKQLVKIEQLLEAPDFERECLSLKKNLLKKGSSGIIAEFKQKSPSKGIINAKADVSKVTRAYVNAGVAGISVLTEQEFFGGTQANLMKARKVNPQIPILRKDFMIDSYQLVEAKAYGADVVLLIAACLGKEQALTLAKDAKILGLEVLMEIHNETELDLINEYVDMVGVNNRNLKTFQVDVETSVKLAAMIPEKYVKISESGLSGAGTIHYLRNNGFKGFLIGETFMKTANPGETCRTFIKELSNKKIR